MFSFGKIGNITKLFGNSKPKTDFLSSTDPLLKTPKIGHEGIFDYTNINSYGSGSSIPDYTKINSYLKGGSLADPTTKTHGKLFNASKAGLLAGLGSLSNIGDSMGSENPNISPIQVDHNTSPILNPEVQLPTTQQTPFFQTTQVNPNYVDDNPLSRLQALIAQQKVGL